MSQIESERKKGHKLPFISLTETWLKSYILDAQLHIPGYNISRSDRDKRVGGGVLLYSHEDIPITNCESFDDSICQAMFTIFDTIKMCVATIYRPPNASHGSFNGVLKFLRNCISDLNDDSFQICIMGDFNFPSIDWQSCTVAPGGSSEISESASALLSFMSDHLMNQYVTSPTRGDNILDLFFTNDDQLVTHVDSTKSDLSDHNMVEVIISSNPTLSNRSHVNVFDKNDFRSLDFHQANFDALNEKLNNVDWVNLRASCSFEEYPAVFTDTIFQICKSVTPLKKPSTGRPKVLHALQRKKKRLQTRLSAAEHGGDPQRIQSLKDEISLICFDIKEAILHHLDTREQAAVSKIKSNPKFFFSYAKSFSKSKPGIAMLFDKDKQITTDAKDMANLLQEQFSSVYSNPDDPSVLPPDFDPPPITKNFSEYSMMIL